jgi:hypothetical protein
VEGGEPDAADVGEEIDHIEAEILRLSSRLHHLRCAQQPEPKRVGGGRAARGEGGTAADEGAQPRPLEVVAASTVNPNPLVEKPQPPRAAWGPKPTKQAPAPQGRGLSLGPLDVATANPGVPAAAPQQRLLGEGVVRPILKPIKEPPVQRCRGVSLGPLEIHRGVSIKPSTTAAAQVKPFLNRLSSVREEGQHSTAKVTDTRGGSSKVTDTRGNNAKATETIGGNAAVGAGKVVGEVKAKGIRDHTGSGGTGRRPGEELQGQACPEPLQPRSLLIPGSWNTRETSPAITPGISRQWKQKGDRSKGY